jgi:UDP-N-acetylglucosamine 2-epimerase (non-hydrolysing)
VAETLLHVLGTRADFAKAAPVVRALADAGVPQDVVHAGRHDDAAATDVFFAAHGLPTPLVDLGVGPASPGRQTGLLLSGLEDVVSGHDPALVVAYGDGNAALATALTCAKAPVPFAHVEAGMRAGDRGSAEEVNRAVVDSLAALHLATSADAVDHLTAEGADPAQVHLVGNPLVEGLGAALPQLDPAPVRARLGLGARYAVATLDRPGDVDDRDAAAALAGALETLGRAVPVVAVLPRRARRRLAAAGLTGSDRLTMVDPLPYHEHLAMLRGAAVVVTDAGAVQDETTALGVPCLTVQPRTERPVTVSHGTNRLTGTDGLADAAAEILGSAARPESTGPPLWDGRAGLRIAGILAEWHAAARLLRPWRATLPRPEQANVR